MNNCLDGSDWEYTDNDISKWDYYDVRFRTLGTYIAHMGVHRLPEWWFWSHA